jgi:hypothetical protein
LPDIILKEYYAKHKEKNKYRYYVSDEIKKEYPDYFIVTNYDILIQYVKNSSSKETILKLKKHGYKQKAIFYPDLPFLNDRLGFFISNLAPMSSITIYGR